MDPITQGAAGAVVAQLGSRRRHLAQATVVGALAGMAPDLDVLIRSDTDPLLVLDYHRQFTHSLFAIPLIGALCGWIAYRVAGRRFGFTRAQAILWATLGCATHGVLDGCTSYGTQLLWPLTDRRFAWDLISVVDPLFTLPVMLALALALCRRSPRWSVAAASWALVYLGTGFIQHERAVSLGEALAESRGHEVVRLEAKPSFANLVVWKVIYATGERFYVDAVRPGWGEPRIWQGDTVAKLDVARAYPWLAADAQQRRDIARFNQFSAGFVAVDPKDPQRVIDVRYSMLPQEIDPLWGIQLSPDKPADAHVAYFTERDNSDAALRQLLHMIF